MMSNTPVDIAPIPGPPRGRQEIANLVAETLGCLREWRGGMPRRVGDNTWYLSADGVVRATITPDLSLLRVLDWELTAFAFAGRNSAEEVRAMLEKALLKA